MLYQLHPSERDVIMEGRYDAGIVRWFLRERGITGVSVFAVDDRVAIHREAVLEIDHEWGARGRVVALATLAELWEIPLLNLTTIVDRDVECFETRAYPSGLLLTDGGDIQAYCLQTAPIRRFLHSVGRADVDADELLAAMLPALNSVRVVRYVLHKEGPGIPLIDRFAACCQFGDGTIDVDASELVRRSAASRGAARQVGTLVAAVDNITELIPNDRKLAVRGHDVAPLLIGALRLVGDFARPPVVEALLRSSLHPEDLEGHRLFQELIERLGEPSAQ